jgi:hypothetical protein
VEINCKEILLQAVNCSGYQLSEASNWQQINSHVHCQHGQLMLRHARSIESACATLISCKLTMQLSVGFIVQYTIKVSPTTCRVERKQHKHYCYYYSYNTSLITPATTTTTTTTTVAAAAAIRVTTR